MPAPTAEVAHVVTGQTINVNGGGYMSRPQQCGPGVFDVLFILPSVALLVACLH